MSVAADARAPEPAVRARLTACPCCGGALSAPFYEVARVPVHSCLMLDSAEAARSFPEGMLTLAFCADCGFATNIDFDPKWSAYAPNYEDQQSFSPTFNSFAGQQATDLIARYGLAGRSAVEIGCSKGDFMRLLAEAGGMDCVGIDPSALPGRVPAPRRGAMRFHQEYYGPQHTSIPADLLCCRHTLEHIQDVAGLLATARAHLAGTPGGVFQIEVPDAARVWQECAFEDIYYEHCSYFTAGALARALRRAGFAVTDLRREYDGQYLVAEAVLDPTRDRRFEIEETPAEAAAMIAGFRARIGETRDRWRRLVSEAARTGRVGIWGSGSKCVAFLRTLGLAAEIEMIVDINPHRAGRYAPGLGLPISAPEVCREAAPDVFVVMNRIYLDEIREMLAGLGAHPRLEALGGLPA